MGLNNVDVSCIGTRVAKRPSPYAIAWGLRRGVEWERVGGRREEEEEERWERAFYMTTPQVPS